MSKEAALTAGYIIGVVKEEDRQETHHRQHVRHAQGADGYHASGCG